MEGHSIAWLTREKNYSISRFVSELIECYWRFANCRGSCHERQMEHVKYSVLIYVSVFVVKGSNRRYVM